MGKPRGTANRSRERLNTLREASSIDDFPVREGKSVRMLRRDRSAAAERRKRDAAMLMDKEDQLRKLRNE